MGLPRVFGGMPGDGECCRSDHNSSRVFLNTSLPTMLSLLDERTCDENLRQ